MNFVFVLELQIFIHLLLNKSIKYDVIHSKFSFVIKFSSVIPETDRLNFNEFKYFSLDFPK